MSFLIFKITFLMFLSGTLSDSQIVTENLTRNSYFAKNNQFPYVAYVAVEGELFMPWENYSSCSATIIHKQWALTSAGCSDQGDQLVVGTADLGGPIKDLYEIDVRFKHPQYATYKYNNIHQYDFGLLRVSEEIKFNVFVQRAFIDWKGLWENYLDYNISIYYMSWGQNKICGVCSQKLKYVSDFIMPRDDCALFSQEFHICLPGAKNKAKCPANPGGPLMHLNKMIGVVNHIRCGGDALVLAENIKHGIPWIRKTLREVSRHELWEDYGNEAPEKWTYLQPDPSEMLI